MPAAHPDHPSRDRAPKHAYRRRGWFTPGSGAVAASPYGALRPLAALVALSLLLAMLVTGSIPNTAQAGGGPGDAPLDGDGTEESPYLIRTLEDLEWVRDQTNAESGWSTNKHFRQTADIDLCPGDTCASWTPIGRGQAFSGAYDGGFFSIEGLSIATVTTETNFGLFGDVSNAEIKNLKLIEVDIDVTSSNSAPRVGALAGRAGGTTSVQRVSVSGEVSVTATDPGSDPSLRLFVGGVVGQSANTASLNDQVSFRGRIEIDLGEEVTTLDEEFANVGGIVGRTSGTSSVSLAYAQTDFFISGVVGGGNLDVGAAVGSSSTAISSLVEMYAVGNIVNSATDGGAVNFGVVGDIPNTCDSTLDFYHAEGLSPFGRFTPQDSPPSDCPNSQAAWIESSRNGFIELLEEDMQGEGAAEEMKGEEGTDRWRFGTKPGSIWTVQGEGEFPIFFWETIEGGTTVPDAPEGLSVEVLGTTATIWWHPPTVDGYPGTVDEQDRILNYNVSRVGFDDTFLCPVAGTDLTCVIESLAVEEEHTFEVAAVNVVGEGPRATANPVTPTAPPQPTLTVTPRNAALDLNVTFTDFDPSVQATNFEYRIRVSEEDWSDWTPRNPPSTVQQWRLDGLTNGTTYEIEVRAVAPGVDGLASDPVSGRPVAPPAPAPAPAPEPDPTPEPVRTVEGSVPDSRALDIGR